MTTAAPMTGTRRLKLRALPRGLVAAGRRVTLAAGGAGEADTAATCMPEAARWTSACWSVP